MKQVPAAIEAKAISQVKATYGLHDVRVEHSCPMPREDCWLLLCTTGNGHERFAVEVDENGNAWQADIPPWKYETWRERYGKRAHWAR